MRRFTSPIVNALTNLPSGYVRRRRSIENRNCHCGNSRQTRIVGTRQNKCNYHGGRRPVVQGACTGHAKITNAQCSAANPTSLIDLPEAARTRTAELLPTGWIVNVLPDEDDTAKFVAAPESSKAVMAGDADIPTVELTRMLTAVVTSTGGFATFVSDTVIKPTVRADASLFVRAFTTRLKTGFAA